MNKLYLLLGKSEAIVLNDILRSLEGVTHLWPFMGESYSALVEMSGKNREELESLRLVVVSHAKMHDVSTTTLVPADPQITIVDPVGFVFVYPLEGSFWDIKAPVMSFKFHVESLYLYGAPYEWMFAISGDGDLAGLRSHFANNKNIGAICIVAPSVVVK